MAAFGGKSTEKCCELYAKTFFSGKTARKSLIFYESEKNFRFAKIYFEFCMNSWRFFKVQRFRVKITWKRQDLRQILLAGKINTNSDGKKMLTPPILVTSRQPWSGVRVDRILPAERLFFYMVIPPLKKFLDTCLVRRWLLRYLTI